MIFQLVLPSWRQSDGVFNLRGFYMLNSQRFISWQWDLENLLLSLSLNIPTLLLYWRTSGVPLCHQFISNTYWEFLNICNFCFGLFALGIMLMQAEYVSLSSLPVCSLIQHIFIEGLLYSNYMTCWGDSGEPQSQSLLTEHWYSSKGC